jgi:hypothetical protein
MRHFTYLTILASFGLVLGANMAAAAEVSYFGRWTVSDEKPDYSSKGLLYKTVDIAPCGKDFCGVSVDDKGVCGPTLFRFFTAHAKDADLSGHGRWGKEKKKLEISYAQPSDAPPYLVLGVGDAGMDLTGREGSLPTFEANYKFMGKSSCSADAPLTQ